MNDIKERLVRVLHPLSFVDDPTRMLRAVRFEERLNFNIEMRTLELLVEAKPLVGQVSGDRIRHELDHILDLDERVNILERLSTLGLLGEIHPNLVWDAASRQNLEMLDFVNIKPLHGIKLELGKGNNLRKLAYILWFIHQPVEKTLTVLRKLRYPSTQVKDVLAACRLWKDLPWVANAKLSMIGNRLEDVPPIAIYANYLAARDDNICNNFQAYLNRLNTVTPNITGEDLRKWGLPPGPIYKRILGAIREGWLDGKIENNEQEQAYLDELIRNEPGLHPTS